MKKTIVYCYKSKDVFHGCILGGMIRGAFGLAFDPLKFHL